MSTATGRGRLFFQGKGDPPNPTSRNLESAPKKRFSENPPKITKTCVIADFAYIVPRNEYCNRPWPLIFSGRGGLYRSLWISPQIAKSSYWIEPHKKLGLASSQFLDILYPWIGSIKGHYRLVRPGRRGSCGTLVLHKRNQQANVQFGFKTKSRTCVIAVLTYIRGNGHINSLVSPLVPARPYGTRVRPPKSDI